MKQEIENILVPLDTDKRVQLALGIYADGKRKLLGPTAESIPEELPGFTEDARKSLLLQGERLKKLGLQIESREEWLVPTQKEKRTQKRFQWIEDGKCWIKLLRNRMKIRTSFVREKKGSVGSFSENLLVNYEFLKTPEEDLRVVSETRMEQREVFDRSSEYWKEGRWILEKLGVGFYLFCLGSLTLVHLGCLPVMVLSTMGKIDSSELMAAALMFWVVSIFGIGPLSAYCFRMFPSYKRRRASAKVVQHIRQAIPDFCRGDFVSMAESRIKALLFADTLHQVEEFVNGDVQGFLSTHPYAVNYELLNFWFLSFWQDVDQQYIEVLAEAFVSKDNGTRIERYKEYTKVLFAKPLNGIMTHDWYVEKVEVVNRNGK